jgi:hypothetical protein
MTFYMFTNKQAIKTALRTGNTMDDSLLVLVLRFVRRSGPAIKALPIATMSQKPSEISLRTVTESSMQ